MPAQRRLLAAFTIFSSGFLLFTVEPLLAKLILPSFGGSAAVWSTCLVFYQTALLAGYLYARFLTKSFQPRTQALLHTVLLGASLTVLPVGPAEAWHSAVHIQHPVWRILWLLTVTLGLPFVTLSATSPLLQHWLARAGDRTPYALFAVSNFASLAALLAYPFVVEPALDAQHQRIWWSWGFAAFALCCLAFAWLAARAPVHAADPLTPSEPIPVLRPVYWFALAACGSMLLLSVTNHITANVAAVPLIWVLPLAVYLLSFIVGFGVGNWFSRGLWFRLLAIGLSLLAYAVYNADKLIDVTISIPLFLASLFVCCLFCQGELYAHRPEPARLTGFYLAIAAGGAAGAIFVGLIAPVLFDGVYELPFTLVVTALVVLTATWQESPWAARGLWIGVTACLAAVLVMTIRAYHENALVVMRSFYGALRVLQTQSAGPSQVRTLYHGTIQHGAEYMWPEKQSEPIAYYGPDSAISIVLREGLPESPRRLGIVGLGTGTLAAFGRPGDFIRFYEINHQVTDIAQSLFFYLRQSKAKVDVVEGDARLSLAQERQPFDLLALDAFSGDAIPVHLLTREALQLYQRLLKPNGVIAFHVSSNYLALAPVVKQLADEAGFHAVEVKNHSDDENNYMASDWVLVTQSRSVLDNQAILLHQIPIRGRPAARVWTDGYNNLAGVLSERPSAP